MRLGGPLPMAAALLLLLTVPLTGALPGDPPGKAGVSWCTDVVLQPGQEHLLEMGCPGAAIRPGVFSRGCTLNFVMTDGEELYIGTAGHCGPEGKRWHIPGVGKFGITIFREFEPAIPGWRDWALVQIYADARDQVDPTMYRWGGPVNPAGLDARAPVPGDPVLQYGNGYGFGQEDATRGRASAVAAVTPTLLVYPGTVGPGDSGSPVRFASGLAAGIAVAGGVIEMGDNRGYVEDRCSQVDGAAQGATDACLGWQAACAELEGLCEAPFRPGGLYGIVLVTRMDAALAAFEEHLGRELTVLSGQLPQPALG